MSVPLGPHARFDFGDPRERFAAELLDRLWSRYRERVEYVRVYESVIADLGATFVNDHIAFRTLAAQTPLIGGASLSRLVEALGYRARAAYDFPDKHLNALHYEHTHPDLPKLFISELRTWELPPAARATLSPYLTDHRSQLSDDQLAALHNLGHGPADPRLLDAAVAVFEERPWRQPAYADVVAVNEVSQYAAWVLVHGYNVNHFTALINSHAVAKLDDIEKTAAALAAAGVPMKASIEGVRGARLRQTATRAVEIEIGELVSGSPEGAQWTYAYLELAERGDVRDPVTDEEVRFNGFLGPQATQLFEMTRRS